MAFLTVAALISVAFFFCLTAAASAGLSGIPAVAAAAALTVGLVGVWNHIFWREDPAEGATAARD